MSPEHCLKLERWHVNKVKQSEIVLFIKVSLFSLFSHENKEIFCLLRQGLRWLDSGVTVLDYAPQVTACSSRLDKNVVFHSLKTYMMLALPESQGNHFKSASMSTNPADWILWWFHQLPRHHVSLVHLTPEPCLFPSLNTSGPVSFSLQAPGGPDLVWWLRVVWVCPPRCLWSTARPTTTLCMAERNRGGRE